MNQFYDQYQGLTQYELFQIILDAKDYQLEAVEAAKQIVSEKNWTKDLKEKIEDKNKQVKENEQEQHLDDLEKTAYYKKAVEFKEQNNSFSVGISDVPKFESALNEKGIDFYREDINTGAKRNAYPIQTYFFRDEDVAAVDKITGELGLPGNLFKVVKPFWSSAIKVFLIGILVMVILLTLASVFRMM